LGGEKEDPGYRLTINFRAKRFSPTVFTEIQTAVKHADIQLDILIHPAGPFVINEVVVADDDLGSSRG
jgi:hypothetical protein